MNLELAKSTVFERLGGMTKALQIGHWDISIQFERLDQGTLANCNPDPRYQHACICIDADQIDHAEDLLKHLRHELIHIVLAEFEIPFDAARDEFQTREGKNLFFEMQRNAVERTVNHLERILNLGLGATPDKFGICARHEGDQQ